MKKTHTFDEACTYLNTSATSLTDLIATGTVPAAKIGMRWVLRECDLDAYLAEQIGAQTEARRSAYLSGKVIKIDTAVGGVRNGRSKGNPVLPDIPRDAAQLPHSAR